MEKKDYVRNFVSDFVKPDSKDIFEAITKYVGINMTFVRMARKEIIDFFRSNFMIYGNTISYDDLRFDALGNEWIILNNRRDLELFENLIALGYASKVFCDDLNYRLININTIPKKELKYALPELFEYLDSDYYDGLNKGIIKKNRLVIDPEVYYKNIERTCTTKELLEYWFTTDNVPAAKQCDPFYYYLNNKEELILNVATFLYIKGCGPISLLMELNGNTHGGLFTMVDYAFKECDAKAKQEFLDTREYFLNMLEASYKTSIIRKKKGLK